MSAVRWKESDLRPDQHLLLRPADPPATQPEPQAGDPGSDRPEAGVRGRPGGSKGRGGRFRLKAPEPSEAIVMRAVLKYLRLRKDRVAWVERLNSGAGQLAFADGARSQWMRFAWRGAPDLLGQMTDGRILCVETKSPSGRLRPDQEMFLATVRNQGGVAFVARSIDDVKEQLG
jgi:hypothetical protein